MYLHNSQLCAARGFGSPVQIKEYIIRATLNVDIMYWNSEIFSSVLLEHFLPKQLLKKIAIDRVATDM